MVCSRGIGKYVIDVNIIHTCERMSDENENLYRGIQHKVSASLLKGSLNVLWDEYIGVYICSINRVVC